MQAIAPSSRTESPALAADLFAIVVYMNKNCNQDLFEAVGALELTLTQIKLLHFLEDAKTPLSLGEAAERVMISLPAASRTVEDLVRRGFVERQEDPDDRRMKRVRATEAGYAVIRRLNAGRLTGLQKFIDDLTDRERQALGGALSTLIERPEIAACRPDPEVVQ
jgi:DNA-binding MarR family transcriptional regulator